MFVRLEVHTHIPEVLTNHEVSKKISVKYGKTWQLWFPEVYRKKKSR